MTDSERISFLEAHQCSQFLSESGVWVVNLGDCSPLRAKPGEGTTLGAAIDSCADRNFDVYGTRLRKSTPGDAENTPSQPASLPQDEPEAPKPPHDSQNRPRPALRPSL